MTTMDIIEDTETRDAVTESHQAYQSTQDSAKKKEILDEYRHQLAKDPRNVTLLNKVGLASEAAGDNDRARWAYKRAIRLDPGYEESYRNLGLLYRHEGREGQAIDALRQYSRWAGIEVEEIQVDELMKATVEDANSEASVETDARSPAMPTPGQAAIYTRLDQVWAELELTPAEAMMLLDPDNSSGLQMLQYTLLDLVAKRVLKEDGGYRIGRGDMYDQSTLAPHEVLFAKYFSRISDYVDIDKLSRAVLAELDDDDSAFKAAYVRESLLSKGYLQLETRRIAGLLPVQQVVLSKKGENVRSRLQRLLKEADRQMSRSLSNNPEQASAYVEQGGPALLLMDGQSTNQFRRWHDMLARMGLGPAIEQLRSKARKSDLGTYVDEILKVLLGE
jgi:hypothetical protein